jgi:hypothetical protein
MSKRIISYFFLAFLGRFGNKMPLDYVLMGIKREYLEINGNIRGINGSVAFVP